jgi:hypothetical protein
VRVEHPLPVSGDQRPARVGRGRDQDTARRESRR